MEKSKIFNEYRSHLIHVNYEAAPDGTIRNKRRGKSIGVVNNLGYLVIGINVKGKTKMYHAHRFIAEVFLGEIPSGYVVDHIDRNKLNNNVANLRIDTPREKNLNKNPNQSKNRIPRPVTAREIYVGNTSVSHGNENPKDFITDFQSIRSAARYFNIDPASVKRAADGVVSATYSDKFNCKVSFVWS